MQYHQPVMVKEVLRFLNPKSGGFYVDANLGTGGHSQAILEASSPEGKVVAFEWDKEAVSLAKERLKNYLHRLKIFNTSYTEMFLVFKHENFKNADGILFDLGISSFQIKGAKRGFSYQKEGPLDMRMDTSSTLKAADLISLSSPEILGKIIRDFGEEPRGFKIALALKKCKSKITTTTDLKQIIQKVLKGLSPKIIKKAIMRTFQALRIAVNNELENLKKGLEAAVEILAPQGRLIVISFHSLEDKIVKEFFKKESKDCICPPATPVCVCRHKSRLRIITKKVVRPTLEEIKNNPASHSAKMRVAERKKD